MLFHSIRAKRTSTEAIVAIEPTTEVVMTAVATLVFFSPP